MKIKYCCEACGAEFFKESDAIECEDDKHEEPIGLKYHYKREERWPYAVTITFHEGCSYKLEIK